MTKFEKAGVAIVAQTTLSKGWTELSSYDIDYTASDGATHRLKREIYHRTPAATILLYDPRKETVVLVRQFRLAAHLNGDPGWMIETPAGLLDGRSRKQPFAEKRWKKPDTASATSDSCSKPIWRRVP